MHTPGNKALFGALGDSAPDTWGRVLIRRAERQAALDEHRTPRTLGEADTLLGVCDEARQGALRFRFEADGPYQAPSGPQAVPPLVVLPRLLSSSERVMPCASTEHSHGTTCSNCGDGSCLGC